MLRVIPTTGQTIPAPISANGFSDQIAEIQRFITQIQQELGGLQPPSQSDFKKTQERTNNEGVKETVQVPDRAAFSEAFGEYQAKVNQLTGRLARAQGELQVAVAKQAAALQAQAKKLKEEQRPNQEAQQQARQLEEQAATIEKQAREFTEELDREAQRLGLVGMTRNVAAEIHDGRHESISVRTYLPARPEDLPPHVQREFEAMERQARQIMTAVVTPAVLPLDGVLDEEGSDDATVALAVAGVEKNAFETRAPGEHNAQYTPELRANEEVLEAAAARLGIDENQLIERFRESLYHEQFPEGRAPRDLFTDTAKRLGMSEARLRVQLEIPEEDRSAFRDSFDHYVTYFKEDAGLDDSEATRAADDLLCGYLDGNPLAYLDLENEVPGHDKVFEYVEKAIKEGESPPLNEEDSGTYLAAPPDVPPIREAVANYLLTGGPNNEPLTRDHVDQLADRLGYGKEWHLVEDLTGTRADADNSIDPLERYFDAKTGESKNDQVDGAVRLEGGRRDAAHTLWMGMALGDPSAFFEPESDEHEVAMQVTDVLHRGGFDGEQSDAPSHNLWRTLDTFHDQVPELDPLRAMGREHVQAAQESLTELERQASLLEDAAVNAEAAVENAATAAEKAQTAQTKATGAAQQAATAQQQADEAAGLMGGMQFGLAAEKAKTAQETAAAAQMVAEEAREEAAEAIREARAAQAVAEEAQHTAEQLTETAATFSERAEQAAVQAESDGFEPSTSQAREVADLARAIVDAMPETAARLDPAVQSIATHMATIGDVRDAAIQARDAAQTTATRAVTIETDATNLAELMAGFKPELGAMLPPISSPLGNRGFGVRRHPVHGDMRMHSGQDFGGNMGQPLYATADGVVASVEGSPSDTSGYGLVTKVDHGNGIMTYYAHQSGTNVEAGQPVRAGQQIGAVGSSGTSTGAHLHFEVRQNGNPIDPAPWLGSVPDWARSYFP